MATNIPQTSVRFLLDAHSLFNSKCHDYIPYEVSSYVT